MEAKTPIYACIDLKSFYASVECLERGLDPMKANLVVADETRTEKTICLAVSPSLKAYGISGRARLFEVYQALKEYESKTGKKVSFIIAPPRMKKYIEISTKIYEIYLKYIAPEDIYIYSIDEVFIDLSHYGTLYGMRPRALVSFLISEIYRECGITATGGLGTNLYLAKVAMDILAKHETPDENGVRLAGLTEKLYRKRLWNHRPVTDFWRIGPGSAKRLAECGVFTMGDLARFSLDHVEILFDRFGIDAEILIDHAWGFEPCTLTDIRNYHSENQSIQSGQVLSEPYSADAARLIIREMTEDLVLEIVSRGLLTQRLVLIIGYDRGIVDSGQYNGETEIDRYGRKIPKTSRGTSSLNAPTSSSLKIVEEVLHLYDRIIRPDVPVRRMYITAQKLQTADQAPPEQISLFESQSAHFREQALQKTILDLRSKYGHNIIFKGMDLQEEATGLQRGQQMGGHHE